MYQTTFLGRTSSEVDSRDIQEGYQQLLEDEGFYEYYSSQSNASSIIEDESISKQSVNIQLLHQNLKNYGTMRGLHSQVDISTLKRLNQSSYVEFDDQQKYKMNIDINRIYKGVPENSTICDKEYETKTIFHDQLYNLEDQRHNIDVEILQLKFLLKKTEKLNLNSYNAYKSFVDSQQCELITALKAQIVQLKSLRKALEDNQQQENTLHQLSIDQQYYNRLSFESEKLSSQFITSFYRTKQSEMLTNVSQAFTINFHTFQPPWLKQLEQQYTQLQQIQNLILPPIQIFQFQNQTVLQFQFLFLNLLFKKLHQNQHNIWMTFLFKDFLSASFQFDEQQLLQINSNFNENINSPLFDAYFKYVIYDSNNQQTNGELKDDLLILQFQDPLIEQVDLQNQQSPPKSKDKISFFPDFQDIQILFGEMILLEIFHLFFNLYINISRILNLKESVEYVGEQIKLNELLLYLIISQLQDKTKDYEIYTFFKSSFIEQQAIQLYGIFTILSKCKKTFLKLDENSKQLLLIYTQKLLGNKSLVKIQDAQQNLLTTPDNILRKISYESQYKQLCRLQIVNNLVFIHSFILQDTVL
ncbi:unnamed protein product (macronuclear) [Paramecium tetraurelia]|uniref:Uncharacterized protein n=1 Tax=Paramecium tetraurelia TaxID=5888 RepID=A0DW38_PARTE|nr:uncharacterized protein GSPATT00020908001 [Paramecium tetraurelia]CAK87255.1 unnamed protein product [Paramecium tetraurelia]|eukprot:XP_001454652.1 hypothetical protein (macronuclear) [Paramecium tetraurelia strain d4-2]